MADLSTLEGISEAREAVFNKLERGEVTESRALAQDRILRGQTELKANVPIRLLGIVMKSKGKNVDHYAMPLVLALHKFVTGETLPALPHYPDEPIAPTA